MRHLRHATPEDIRAAERDYQRKHWGLVGGRAPRAGVAPDPRAYKGVLVELGELVAVVYRTEKFGDGESDYEHAFLRPRPRLAFNPTGLIVVGGNYTITDRGIER